MKGSETDFRCFISSANYLIPRCFFDAGIAPSGGSRRRESLMNPEGIDSPPCSVFPDAKLSLRSPAETIEPLW